MSPQMLLGMADNPIVFAMANPNPEIDYNLAVETRKDVIMATGRSDFPNQVNNVLGFPYIFRGALDVRATTINEATTRDFLVNNDKIWILPLNGRRPIKIVFEGTMFTAQKSAMDTVDMVEKASLHYRVGVEAVYDQIYGQIELA